MTYPYASFVIGAIVLEEIWRPIAGYEGFYEVSNLGNVRSLDRTVARPSKSNPDEKIRLKGRVLKSGTDRGGYSFVILQNQGRTCRLVHRLVADAFMEDVPGKTQINHIDGNKKNNAVSNLEYCTCSENVKHSLKIGLRKVNSVHAIDKDTGCVVMTFHSIADAQEHFGNRRTANISNALGGRSKTAYGYLWEYA